MTKILVVEDEPGIALGLEDDLRMEGYDVEVIADGAVACRRAKESPFDLILLDVMLPGKDGFEVCRELRRNGEAVELTPLEFKLLAIFIRSAGRVLSRRERLLAGAWGALLPTHSCVRHITLALMGEALASPTAVAGQARTRAA